MRPVRVIVILLLAALAVGCGGSGSRWTEEESDAAIASCIVASGGQRERCECVVDKAQERGYDTREFLAISAATSGERRAIADALIASCAGG